MPDFAKVWTREDVLALPDDGNRYELVDGELLVSPSPRPRHQLTITALLERLLPYLRAQRVGMVLTSPADLDLQSAQLVQPDIFVAKVASGEALEEWEQVGIPMLVVEVLSPSTARFDRITKRRRFQRSGVPVYWIIDIEARLVEVWRPEDRSPEIVDDTLWWRPGESVEPLTIDLPAFFREVWLDP